MVYYICRGSRVAFLLPKHIQSLSRIDSLTSSKVMLRLDHFKILNIILLNLTVILESGLVFNNVNFILGA